MYRQKHIIVILILFLLCSTFEIYHYKPIFSQNLKVILLKIYMHIFGKALTIFGGGDILIKSKYLNDR